MKIRGKPKCACTAALRYGLGDRLRRNDGPEEQTFGPARGRNVSGDRIFSRAGRVFVGRELLGDELGDEAARMKHAFGKRIDREVQAELALARRGRRSSRTVGSSVGRRVKALAMSWARRRRRALAGFESSIDRCVIAPRAWRSSSSNLETSTIGCSTAIGGGSGGTPCAIAASVISLVPDLYSQYYIKCDLYCS